MPIGETNGNYTCDDCGCDMPIGTKAWLDLDKNKIYCLSCRTEEGDTIERPAIPVPSSPKTVVVRHESSKVEDLKKEVTTLRAENKRLKKDLIKLRKHAKELLEISERLRKGKKPEPLSLTEERLRLRGTRS